MAKKCKILKSPTKVWDIYQQYDYLGGGECYKYKGYVFKDQTRPFRTPGEMAIDNAKTKKNIESVSMSIISKQDFNKLVKDIIKKKPKNIKEWLSD